MSNNVGALVESCNFKILNVIINDIEIKPNYITDLSVDWNGEFRIYGYINLNDHYDIVNTMLITPGQTMTIEYIDNHEDKFSRTFSILNSSEVKDQDFKNVSLKFQDTTSYLLSKTFVNKSYKSTTLVDIVKEYLKIEAQPILDKNKVEIYSEPTRTLTNFVVPQHEDFLTFIEKEFVKEGIYFYQIKEKLIIGNNYKEPETPEFPYKQTGGKDLYGFKIMEYDLIYNNIQKTNKVQKASVQVFNKDTKSMDIYNKSLVDFLDEFNLGGKVFNSQLTYGTQLKTKEYSIDTNKYTHGIYRYNTELHIIVPGNIQYSKLYKLVDVKMSGANYTIETRENGDLSLSGKYQISRVEDKFLVGQKFIQRLTLRRVNEGKR